MEKIPIVLVYECIGYFPHTLATLLTTNKALSNLLQKRIDVLHTMLEEVFGYEDWYRYMNFKEWLEVV